MQDPIDLMLAEHREIMADVDTLRRAVDDLRARGEPALSAVLPTLASVGRMLETRLLHHSRKEEDALFPAIERVLNFEQGPTTVMREEHEVIHERAALFRETLRELNDVEHPAIVAGGARLRSLSDRGGRPDVSTLAEAGETVVTLIDAHFAKEEGILFPMARAVLSADDLRDVRDQMDAIEAERT